MKTLTLEEQDGDNEVYINQSLFKGEFAKTSSYVKLP